MQMNTHVPGLKTYQGAPARHVPYEMQLMRSVMSCLLWEKEFYESGETIADRIKKLVPLCKPEEVAIIAEAARSEMHLRHMPLFLVREMARHPKHKGLVSATLPKVIQRADELAEFVSIYWKDGKQPLSGQVKKGLAKSFTKFNEFQLAKYNRDKSVKLRDVLFLCHAKANSDEQQAVWKKLVDGTLATPDTWEVELSASTDKKASWLRLLYDGKLGAMAYLRNLRNMRQAGVPDEIIRAGLEELKADKVLPFRYISAARHNPQFEPELEALMFKSTEAKPKIGGKTIIMVDVSGSMSSANVSGKSEITRLDAACGLAMLARETFTTGSIVSFSDAVVDIGASRRGFALRDAIVGSQLHSGTALGMSLQSVVGDYERMIVITDEQAADVVPQPKWPKSYVINVASAKNGVGYGKWVHIDGWSESVLDYIREYER